MTNKASFTKIIGMVCAILAILSLTSALAFGQAEQGTVVGAVRDSTGAVVAGANVVVKNVATSAERTTATNNLGQYTVAALIPGNYQVIVSKSGFKTYKVTTEVTVGATLTIDAQLSVGSSNTVVEVVAGAVTEVNTETQEVSQLIDTQQMALLPSLTRNAYDFVAISGNVSNGDTTSNGATMSVGSGGGQELTSRGVGYSINGQRASGTEILLDGVENISIFSVAPGEDIPIDAVQEYSIVSNNFSAEYGRASGGVVNVSTKAGSNAFHGSAWEFNRLSAYTANTYNNDVQIPVVPKGIYTRNQFGFQVGGPVVKNKLFFSESTEFTRVRSASTQTQEIPDPQFISLLPANAQAYYNSFGTTSLPSVGVASTWGDWLTAGPGGTCYFKNSLGACITPLVNGATAIPLGTPVMDTIHFTAPFDAGGGLPENAYDLVGRVDYNLNEKNQIFFRFAKERIIQPEGAAFYSAYPQYDVGESYWNQSWLLSANHTFSSYLIDSTKLSFTRFNQITAFDQALTYTPNLMFVANADPVSGGFIAMPGLENSSAPGAGGVPVGGPQNTIQFENDLSWTKGRHNMRFGGQFTYIQLNYAYGAYAQAVEQLGGSTADSMQDLINASGNMFQGAFASQLGGGSGFAGRVGPNAYPCPVNTWGELIGSTVAPGTPTYGQVGTNSCPSNTVVTPPLGSPSFNRSYRYKDWALYAQDSFKVIPRLTINYGVRYEHYGVQHDNHQNLDSNFYFGPGSTLFQQVANGHLFLTQQSPIGQFWKPSWGTIAPRVGFAYDLFGDGKSSLRGGFGISYERNFGNVTFNASFNPPASAVLTSTCPDVSINCTTVITNADQGPLALPTTPPSNLPPTEMRFLDPNIHVAQTQFWSLDIQREVAHNTIVDIGYSGAHGVHLYDLNNVNNVGMAQQFMGAPLVTTPDPATGAPCPSENLGTGTPECLTRPNPQFSNINERGSGGSSAYHALNLKFQTQDFHRTGVSLVANYTWSHSLDDISSTFSDSIQGGSGEGYGSLGYTSVVNPMLDWGPSDYDVRQRLVVSPIWQTPWFKSQKGVGEALGGWSLVGIFTARTGIPFTFYDLNNEEFLYTLPRLTPATTPDYRVSSNPKPIPGVPNSFNLLTVPVPASFAPLNPVTGISDYGPFPANMTGRNAFRGPGAWNFDSAVQKNFKITERYGLEFRAEGFNILNHHNMYTQTLALAYFSPTAIPSTVTGLKGGLNTFGSGGNHDERRFGQFSLRFVF